MRKEKPILVVDRNQRDCQNLCRILLDQGYLPIPLYSVWGLDGYIKRSECDVAFLDMGTLFTQNQSIDNIAAKHPHVRFLGLSENHHGEGSAGALCKDEYACIDKPVDAGEVELHLRSIHKVVGEGKDELMEA